MPPKNLLNQSPKGIVQNNKAMLFVGGIVVALLILFFTYKYQSSQKTVVVENKPKQNIDISSTKDDDPEWMDKHKQEKFDHVGTPTKPQTPQEVQMQVITNQEAALDKQIIEDKYATKLEIQKLQNSNEVEEKKLELEAMKSPLTIPVANLPGTKAAPVDVTSELGNAVKKMQGIAEEDKSVKASDAAAVLADINNQDEKLQFLKKTDQSEDYLKSGLVKPRSPYEVKAGTYSRSINSWNQFRFAWISSGPGQ
jgi:type IV secretory pathway VirB10-like protein